jgi:carbamate kinase
VQGFLRGLMDARALIDRLRREIPDEWRHLRDLPFRTRIPGGVPVVVGPDGGLRGIECVIDKDLSAALLARRVGAEMLVMLTDVPAVMARWGSPEEPPIVSATPSEMRDQCFAEGSMAPKVEAACRFAESTGWVAAIGSLADAAGVVRGTAGTRIALAEADARLAVRQ